MSLDQWIEQNQPEVREGLQEFRKRCRSASTAPSEPDGEPGQKPDGELLATPLIDAEMGALSMDTDYLFVVMSSNGPQQSQTETYY